MGGFFFSSRRRHTRWTGDWSSDVCSSDLSRVATGGCWAAWTTRSTASPSTRCPSGATSCGRSSRPTLLRRALEPLTTRSPVRRILLVDADAFYVAVARLVDPAGAGKAPLLIVGGSPERRGVVTSASYEARAYGVHSAMPMARAVRLCRNATVVPVPW